MVEEEQHDGCNCCKASGGEGVPVREAATSTEAAADRATDEGATAEVDALTTPHSLTCVCFFCCCSSSAASSESARAGDRVSARVTPRTSLAGSFTLSSMVCWFRAYQVCVREREVETQRGGEEEMALEHNVAVVYAREFSTRVENG